jgi:hypothetical protein
LRLALRIPCRTTLLTLSPATRSPKSELIQLLSQV